MAKYKRILLKLSGEALAGDKKTGFDEETCIMVGKQVKKLIEDGIQVAIVIGGGNFWRGRKSETIDRVKADQIGMLATVMNCIYVSDIFRFLGLGTSIYTPFSCGSMTKLFSKDSAVEDLENGKVVFLAGGTGHPYFSTDSATSLRAIELNCDMILMAKAVDGVYDSDPNTNPNAKKFDKMSINTIIDNKLGVIDMTAAVLCLENKMPLFIFSLLEKDGIVNAATGKASGTVITAD
ncbi:MAG: UMP kinase [Lachnospiraceae bacterium]|nr:UMP kinase [Lachnospiraceae bacterium]